MVNSFQCSKAVVAKMENSSEDLLAELDEKVKSMIEKSQNMITIGDGQTRRASVCKVCGKEGQNVAIRDHIEANHLEGIILPCNFCDKTCRSRNALRRHMYCHTTNNWWFFPEQEAHRDSTLRKIIINCKRFFFTWLGSVVESTLRAVSQTWF